MVLNLSNYVLHSISHQSHEINLQSMCLFSMQFLNGHHIETLVCVILFVVSLSSNIWRLEFEWKITHSMCCPRHRRHLLIKSIRRGNHRLVVATNRLELIHSLSFVWRIQRVYILKLVKCASVETSQFSIKGEHIHSKFRRKFLIKEFYI